MKIYTIFLFLLLALPIGLASEIVFEYDIFSDTVIYAGVQENILPEQRADEKVYVGVEYTIIREDGTQGYSGILSEKNYFSYNSEENLVLEIEYEGETSYVSLGLCNSNGLCEPCLKPGCSFMETALSCSDCSEEDIDGYCNLLTNVCDPDCEEGLDKDCGIFKEALPELSEESALQYSFTIIGLFLVIIFLVLVVVRGLHASKHKQERIALMQHYILDYRSRGYGDTSIRTFFVDKGYSEEFINKIFKSLEK